MTPDAATLGLATVLLLGVLGVLLALSWLVNPNRQALAWWGAAFATAGLGIAFIGPTRTVPEAPMLLAGNALVATAYALQYTGCRVFDGHAPSLPLGFAGPALWLAAWPFLGEWFEARLMLMSLIAAGYNLLSAAELARGCGERLATQRAATILLCVGAAFHLGRGIVGFAPTSVPWLDPVARRWSSQLGLVLLVYVPALAFAFMSMTKERVEREVRAAADRIRESEARYRALVGASSAIFWRAAADGRVIASDGWSKLSGLPHEAPEGVNWLDLVHPDDLECVRTRWREVRASGRAAEHRYRIRTTSGGFRWMSARTVPILNPDGGVREWVGTLSDIHNETTAQDGLARSEERYRLAAMAVNGAVWDRDLVDGRIDWAERGLGVFGYPPEEIDPSTAWWTGRIHPEDRQRVAASMAAAIAGDSAHWTQEYRFRRGDGRYAEVLDRGFMMRDAGGRPRRMVGAVQDISERLRLEAQLRQSQKMEAVGQLTGGIAHDFNNLLTIVLGHAELLASDESLPADVRAQAQAILEAGTRGSDLTRHLLSFGRRQSLRTERLALDRVIGGLQPILARALGEQIDLVTAFEPGLPRALTDRALLESALLNLVVNARDALPDGGRVTIAVGRGVLRAGSRAALCLRVTDTGTGMAPEVAERAFEPFFTTKEAGRGSGLGLSMVYGFARQSGGEVDIASRPGEGTSIAIRLPAEDADGAEADDAEADGPSLPAPHGLAASAQAGGRERILVVEDEPEVLGFVQAQLASLRYEVTAVSNGADALGMLRSERRFDLLFTDVVLPKGMSGVELARHARILNPAIRVLLTSGYPEEVFEHHGRPQEGTALLRKPYRRGDLAAAIRQALAERDDEARA